MTARVPTGPDVSPLASTLASEAPRSRGAALPHVSLPTSSRDVLLTGRYVGTVTTITLTTHGLATTSVSTGRSRTPCDNGSPRGRVSGQLVAGLPRGGVLAASGLQNGALVAPVDGGRPDLAAGGQQP